MDKAVRSHGLYWRIVVAGLAAAGLVAGCGAGGDGPPSPASSFEVSTLSSRPDLISGGDTLLQVRAPAGVALSSVRVLLNGLDVTAQLTERDGDGRTLRGVISGLRQADGGAANRLQVINADQPGAPPTELTLINYPITGPILSGPQITPYECRTVENGLGQPLDANCTAATQVVWYYRTSANSFAPLNNPAGPWPADLVNTTTTEGKTVPYIVRVESGTINRGVYRLAVLDNPRDAPAGARWKPGAGWNRKLIVYFNGGGSAQYNQGVHVIATALNHLTLSQGFAYMNSTELWNDQHANPHLQGETVMMLKEHFIKTFGVPKWTAGTGGSGGSIQQYLIAQLYPGLLDGIQPSASFPDTRMDDVTDCRLLDKVYDADPATWTTAKQNAVNGFNTNTCRAWDMTFANIVQSDFAPGCGVTNPVTAANIFNRATNPGGLRCDMFQTNVNLLGTWPGTREARAPLDNVGVQYGLAALNTGAIPVAEFLDLNQKIGGYDRDGNPTGDGTRSAADPGAIRAAYEGGFKNSFSSPGLTNIPIITSRNNADLPGTRFSDGDMPPGLSATDMDTLSSLSGGDIHDSLQDLIVRARLQRANGRSDNQIILASNWTNGVDIAAVSLDLMNRWLDNIAADPAPPSTDKVVRDKPADAHDACWDASGQRIDETASTDPAARCNQIYPRHSTVRLNAGMPIDSNVIKCQLKPIDLNDYRVAFSPDEAARLRAIFPNGVCDWSQPSASYMPLRGTYLRLPLTGG